MAFISKPLASGSSMPISAFSLVWGEALLFLLLLDGERVRMWRRSAFLGTAFLAVAASVLISAFFATSYLMDLDAGGYYVDLWQFPYRVAYSSYFPFMAWAATLGVIAVGPDYSAGAMRLLLGGGHGWLRVLLVKQVFCLLVAALVWTVLIAVAFIPGYFFADAAGPEVGIRVVDHATAGIRFGELSNWWLGGVAAQAAGVALGMFCATVFRSGLGGFAVVCAYCVMDQVGLPVLDLTPAGSAWVGWFDWSLLGVSVSFFSDYENLYRVAWLQLALLWGYMLCLLFLAWRVAKERDIPGRS